MHTPFRLACLLAVLCAAQLRAADALEAYLARPDDSFKWEIASRKMVGEFGVAQVLMTSQTWRSNAWKHDLQIAVPPTVRHPDTAFLLISGDGTGNSYRELLSLLAESAGATVAIITRIPNQPLYDGRREDALIAYTFDKYLRTGDETWPLLFPMVKSAVRGMDTVQAVAKQEKGYDIKKFVIAGASKRGWTTWLTGAMDKRVVAIAPMVIDMLNMKAQTDWAQKVYGKQSEQISDYTQIGLIEHMDDPPMRKLRGWVDPYSYRERYRNIPKLILLGTNDPYWTVDSLRHYWSDLPGEKFIFQTPNAGHNLGGGKQASQTLAAFFQMVADQEERPAFDWKFDNGPKPRLHMKVNRPAASIRLWTADSADRDFRNDKWTSRELEIKPGSSIADTAIELPASGYRAVMGEVVLKTAAGREYKLSTQVQVLPDNVK
jgi:PhoPQ-activated pathogenicity-related protein